MKKRLIEPVSISDVARILRRAFGLAASNAKITLLRGGLFNTSYKAILRSRKAVVLCIAPSKEKPLLGFEKALLKREINFLSILGRVPLENSAAKKRTLFYKACGCLQAALEESLHFGKTKTALKMISYYKANTEALKLILC